MRKTRMKRVFKQYDEQAKAWVWMREYIVTNARGEKHREVRKSPCQCNPALMGG